MKNQYNSATKITRATLWNRLKTLQFIIGAMLVLLFLISISLSKPWLLILFANVVCAEVIISLWCWKIEPVKLEDYDENIEITPEFLDYLEYAKRKKEQEQPLWIAATSLFFFVIIDVMLLVVLICLGFPSLATKMFFTFLAVEFYSCIFISTREVDETGRIMWLKKHN